MLAMERKIRMHVLAVDIGTQSLKASVINEALEVLERHTSSYQPRTYSGSCVEIDAEVLWNAFLLCCSRIVYRDVVGIVFSSLCPSLLLMAENGEALTPIILHLDRRSEKQSSWIVKTIGLEKFRSITGNPPIAGGMSVTSMLWIKENCGGTLPPGAVFGHAVTFFIKRLTGDFFMDPSHASFTGLYETLRYADWSEKLLGLTGITRNQLPSLRDSISIVGEISSTAAQRTGLAKGAAVIIGANDTTCAVAGAGIREPGMLLNTAGTVEILTLCTDTPTISDSYLIRTHAYRNRWLLMRTLGAGGASVEWFRRNFCKEMSNEEFYGIYYPRVLSRNGPSSVVFEPYLTGDRHRLEAMQASFSHITLDTGRGDFLYSLVYHNIQFLLQVLPEWEQLHDVTKRIYVVGGGAGDAYTNLKRRMLPSYEFLQSGETAEKGAAMIGFEAMGKERT